MTDKGASPAPGKTPISLRVDTDILEWFREQGGQYQSHMNEALRRYKERAQGGKPRVSFGAGEAEEEGEVAFSGVSLSHLRLFRSLSVEDRESISRRCTVRRYDTAQAIQDAGDRQAHVHFIISGRVRLHIFSSAGKEVVFRDFSAGQTFGEIAAIEGLPGPWAATSLSESLVASIDRDSFLKILAEHNSVARAMLIDLASTARALSERVIEFSTLPVRYRVRAELVRLAREQDPTGTRVSLRDPPSHAYIASRIDSVREAVTRELNILEEKGLVKRAGGQLEIDVQRLWALFDGV